MITESLAAIIKRQREAYFKRKYVYFRKEAIKKKLKPQEFKDKVDELITAGYKQIHKTTVRKYWKPNTFSLAKDDHKISLCYYDGKSYFYYFTNCKYETEDD